VIDISRWPLIKWLGHVFVISLHEADFDCEIIDIQVLAAEAKEEEVCKQTIFIALQHSFMMAGIYDLHH